MTETPEAPVIDWDAVRLRYEGSDEKLSDIASSINSTQPALSARARRHGWTLRKPLTRKTTTAEALRRLKEGLQERLSQFEGDVAALRDGVTAASRESEVRNTNMLLRTLEKVLELENRQNKQRKFRAGELTRLNNSQRDELARRIESLRAEQPATEPDAADRGGAGTAVGMAPVGET